MISDRTLKQMPISTAFIKETTRLATIVDLIIPRIVTKPVKLPNGDVMPPGTEWAVDIQRMAQVKQLWSLFLMGYSNSNLLACLNKRLI